MKKWHKKKKTIQERWDKLGFLDGLQGHIKDDIAKLYESETKHIIDNIKE
jgi:hypothetical protein